VTVIVVNHICYCYCCRSWWLWHSFLWWATNPKYIYWSICYTEIYILVYLLY